MRLQHTHTFIPAAPRLIRQEVTPVQNPLQKTSAGQSSTLIFWKTKYFHQLCQADSSPDVNRRTAQLPTKQMTRSTWFFLKGNGWAEGKYIIATISKLVKSLFGFFSSSKNSLTTQTLEICTLPQNNFTGIPNSSLLSNHWSYLAVLSTFQLDIFWKFCSIVTAYISMKWQDTYKYILKYGINDVN